jgi:type IV secretion system protein VirB1
MKNNRTASLLAITLLSVSCCMGQGNNGQRSNAKLSAAEFNTIAAACAPNVPLVTLRAMARAESAFHPYALSLNYPRRTAQEQGIESGGLFLARQPRTLEEGQQWARWLSRRGRSASIGLLQINSEHANDLGLTPDELFDPCTNVRAGARLLRMYYRQAAAVLGEGQQALQYALSGYNSGSPLVGFRNGYVDAVLNGEFFSAIAPAVGINSR